MSELTKIDSISDHALRNLARLRRAESAETASGTRMACVSAAFVFEETPEGHNFWNDVAKGRITELPEDLISNLLDVANSLGSDALLEKLPPVYRDLALKYLPVADENARLSDFKWDCTDEGFLFWSSISAGKFISIPDSVERVEPAIEGVETVTEAPKPFILLRGYGIVGTFGSMVDVLAIVEEDPEPSAFILVDINTLKTASFTPRTVLSLNWQ